MGNEAWRVAMMHDPDADDFFGHHPYKGTMPSVDAPMTGKRMATPMEMQAVATFLAAQGDDPSDRHENKAKLDLGASVVKERCKRRATCSKGKATTKGAAPPRPHRTAPFAWTRAQIANPTSR